MVAMLIGHDNQQDADFIVGIFGKQEDLGIMAQAYLHYFWTPYHPVSDEDFDNLPVIFEIAFRESDTEEPLFHVRWVCSSGEEIIDEDAFKKQRLNVVNTKYDTDLIRMITGK